MEYLLFLPDATVQHMQLLGKQLDSMLVLESMCMCFLLESDIKGVDTLITLPCVLYIYIKKSREE